MFLDELPEGGAARRENVVEVNVRRDRQPDDEAGQLHEKTDVQPHREIEDGGTADHQQDDVKIYLEARIVSAGIPGLQQLCARHFPQLGHRPGKDGSDLHDRGSLAGGRGPRQSHAKPLPE